MFTPPAMPRFATLKRALWALLIIVGAVGAGLLAAPVVGGKPSGATIAAETTRDLTPVLAVPVLATAPEAIAPVETPAPVTTSQEAKPQDAAPETAAPAPETETPALKPCQEDQPCWDPCTMGNKTPCDVTPAPETETPAPKPCQEDNACWNSCTMGNRGPCDASAALPYGARFHVAVLFTPGSDCQDGWVLARVTVSVRSAADVELTPGGVAEGCAPGGDVFVGQGVGAALPMLYRQAASQLD